MNLLKISIFSINNDLIKLTYQNYEQPCQRSQNPEFQSHFKCLKLVESFQKNSLIRRPTYIIDFFLNLILKVLYLLKMCPIFVGFVHNFDKSDDYII